MDPREDLLVENQKRVRHANERLRDHVVGMVRQDRRVPFICECATESCTDPVRLTLDEYSRVRDDHARFLIVPGHRTIEGEDVVEEAHGYAIVEKPAALAR